MLDIKKIEQISKQIQEIVPQPLKDLGNDFESKLKALLQAQFNKLNLVSQEDLDVQTQVISRNRQKVVAVEQELEQLKAEILELRQQVQQLLAEKNS